MVLEYSRPVMDALLAAQRFPRLTLLAMRGAIVCALATRRSTPSALVGDALMRFEHAVQRDSSDGVRPALLFAERDRIVREMRVFIAARLAARLFALPRRDLVALGEAARPFDAIVRNARGELHGVICGRLPGDVRRLEWIRRIGEAGYVYRSHRLDGLVIYDFRSGRVRRLTVQGVRTWAA